MIGSVTIRSSEKGFAVDAELEQVNVMGKLECMSALATALEMDKLDIMMFCELQMMGIFDAAKSVTHCETAEELDQMLHGVVPEPEEGEPKNEEDAELKNLMEALLRKLGG